MKKLTPALLDVLRKMAGGTPLTWRSDHRYRELIRLGPCRDERPVTRQIRDRLITLRLIEAQDCERVDRGIYTLTPAGRAAVEGAKGKEQMKTADSGSVAQGNGCGHEVTKPGPRFPLRYGSAETEVCVVCGYYAVRRGGLLSDFRPGPVPKREELP